MIKQMSQIEPNNTTYVYLNTYKDLQGNLYHYVGTHTWNGPTDRLDPSYHGSSRIANLYGWKPIEESIIEVCTESNRRQRENYWIHHYATTLGVSLIAKQFSPKWSEQYKTGSLLNCYENTTSNSK